MPPGIGDRGIGSWSIFHLRWSFSGDGYYGEWEAVLVCIPLPHARYLCGEGKVGGDNCSGASLFELRVLLV